MKTFRLWIGAAIAAISILASGIAGAVGLDGFDPVSCFSGHKPVKGSEQFIAAHQGETYHLSSAANRDLFTANPERFLPQYGGHCAWAASGR